MFWVYFSTKGISALIRVNGIMKIEVNRDNAIEGKPEAECEESWNRTLLDLPD